nr:hypothetical protein [uncultured Sphingomonas sp.]
MKPPIKLLSDESDNRRALIRARNNINAVYSDLQWYVEQGSEGKEERALQLARIHADTTRNALREALRLFDKYVAEPAPRVCDDCDYTTTEQDVTVCPFFGCKGSVG